MSDLEYLDNDIKNLEKIIKAYIDARKKPNSERASINQKIKVLNERKRHWKSILKKLKELEVDI